MSTITVMINSQVAFEYDTPKRLPGTQRRFLDQMDEDMNQGITLDDTPIDSPSQTERNQYVVLHLIDAVEKKSEKLREAMCAYLSSRCPELTRIEVTIDENEYRYALKFGD